MVITKKAHQKHWAAPEGILMVERLELKEFPRAEAFPGRIEDG